MGIATGAIIKGMTIAEINVLAEEYARRYNPQNVAPFPYENVLANQKNLDIVFTDLEDSKVSGMTLYRDGHYTVLVNATKPTTRQNFTLGHELGHYFLHQEILKAEQGIIDSDAWLDGPNILYRLDDVETTRIETEANNFAASLLMPAQLVYKAWEATEDIEKCARIFQVSVVAMSVRLTRLGLVS